MGVDLPAPAPQAHGGCAALVLACETGEVAVASSLLACGVSPDGIFASLGSRRVLARWARHRIVYRYGTAYFIYTVSVVSPDDIFASLGSRRVLARWAPSVFCPPCVCRLAESPPASFSRTCCFW